MIDEVKEFHEKYGCVINLLPTIVDAETANLRRKLIREECQELLLGMCDNDIVEIADGLADLLYVVLGTAVSYGIPIEKVFRLVHESNMTKTTLKDPGGKVIGKDKDGGFEPVDLEWLRAL